MRPIEEVEIQIEMAKRIQSLRDNCITLMQSKEFKDVIEEGYFKEEAARLVMAKSSFMDETQKQLIDNMIYGIGAFKNWLESNMRRGDEMDQALAGHKKTREELLKEEVLQ